MADEKLTQLTAISSASSDDIFYVVDDPTGSALSRKITFANFESSLNHNNLTNTHNLTTDIDHNQLTNYAANQHVVLPNTITNVLSDHNLVAHTALGLFNESSDVDHDATTNFVANEHIDWTADQGATNIHSGNIPDLSATYAIAAKGVTNGDSHDHSGGDGAQINHTTLSNIGTNTHAQIDTHIADSSDPHGATLTQTAITITGDQSSADTAYVPMVLYGTDDTPPTASNFPIGTLYVKYTP